MKLDDLLILGLVAVGGYLLYRQWTAQPAGPLPRMPAPGMDTSLSVVPGMTMPVPGTAAPITCGQGMVPFRGVMSAGYFCVDPKAPVSYAS